MSDMWTTPGDDPRTPQLRLTIEMKCDGLGADAELGREVPHSDGTVAPRDALAHVIEEYARHAGHANFPREYIDGRTSQ